MALSSLPRFMTVLVLAAAAIVQAPQRTLVAAATTTTTSSAVDVCEDSNLACAEDTVCSACRETASSNTDGFQQCIANYVYSASICTNQDTVCSACRETASSNTDGFEQCIANYVYSASICTNQAAQACCQAEASSTDCLANKFYVAYYDCRLVNDVVGEECTGLSCAAVGTSAPTPVGGVVDPTMSPTVVDDDPTAVDADWAARTVPLGVKNTAVAAVFATAGLLVALPAALI
ncbi:expressed unknown protein [Ectocarpus siliculosus]|uniref:Uncharacterized protein n=1 Tax=Ectocarpus siliculosus TaxID=2880 RepID=D7FIB8_ECTSI|nr:expressed unknown protein [Ectocarpus siliculosus]|eukprot:CBJ28742.1 expressed unknown protein [Ectocarpus siliculosus]